jgi:hypothetical protein
MEKRYQVFVSSTYADLKEERQKVIQALMEMDCIPAGMELFPASDDEQFKFIKRVIDDCDYYILIIGGRYGSLSSAGISYTELEFDYAISRGLKVLAFVHEAPDELSVKNSEIEPSLREKLVAFRTKVCDGRVIKHWRTAAELPGLVALSLQKTIKIYPALGWVRGGGATNPELLADLNAMRKENDALKSMIADLKKSQPISSVAGVPIAGLGDGFNVKIRWTETDRYGQQKRSESVFVSWEKIFASIAPSLQEMPNDGTVSYTLGAALFRLKTGGTRNGVKVDDQDFETIRIQLTALGLVNVERLQTTQGGYALFWQLTARGAELMISLRTIKASS